MELNVIYTPGAVRYMAFFALSLLEHSACQVRLVSNGCDVTERRLLAQLADSQVDMSYHEIPCPQMLPHHDALKHLHALSDGDFFCFVDSDLLATGPFMDELLPLIEGSSAVCSGAPVWVSPRDQVLPKDFRMMSGIHSRAHDGICLGSTFFAIYDNRLLTRVMQESGLGFNSYRWDEIPVAEKVLLAKKGLQHDYYDTAKVLSLALTVRGYPLAYRDSDYLHHIGGASLHELNDAGDPSLISRAADLLAIGPLATLLEARRTRRAYPWLKGFSAEESEAIVRRRRGQRNPVRKYFAELLMHLHDGTGRPAMPDTSNIAVNTRMMTATEAIVELHARTGLT